MNKRLLFTVFILSSLCLGSSCKKDQAGRVPEVPVDIDLFLNLPSNVALSVPGGWQYITGGSQGIIVYRISDTEFSAMDRHCPYEPDNNDRVSVTENNIIASDTTNCGSKFVITDGSLSEGPASLPLTTYNTTFTNTNGNPVLRIFN